MRGRLLTSASCPVAAFATSIALPVATLVSTNVFPPRRCPSSLSGTLPLTRKSLLATFQWVASQLPAGGLVEK